jgi:hypothetical protein
MRLLKLNGNGGFILETFRTTIPPYAILSHNGEATAMKSHSRTSWTVLERIRLERIRLERIRLVTRCWYGVFCGGQAKSDGLSYFWVDTC